jgi:hypothetical protein
MALWPAVTFKRYIGQGLIQRLQTSGDKLARIGLEVIESLRC